MSKFRYSKITILPTKVDIKIPTDLAVRAPLINETNVKAICKRHGVDDVVHCGELKIFLLDCAHYYRQQQIVLPQLPQFRHTVASRKQAEELFNALGHFLELYTSPLMVPRVLHAYKMGLRDNSADQCAERYNRTANELDGLLTALEAAIEFDGRAHVATATKMDQPVRFTSRRLLEYGNEVLGLPGSLSGRGGDRTAFGFVQDCLGLITGKTVSDGLIRGSDVPVEARKKRKRDRVRRRAAT